MKKEKNIKELKGLIYCVVIFMDDDKSAWTKKDIENYKCSQIIPNCNFIEHEARKYGHQTYLIPKYFQSNEKIQLKYKGICNENYYKHVDALDQVSKCLGYKNKNEFDAFIKQEIKDHPVIYMVIFNSNGTSAAYCDSINRKKGFIEHCICRNNYSSGRSKSYEGSFAHEILHLFGAEDYYQPPKIKELATKLCPNDIMLKVHDYIAMNTIDEYSAYCIGWINQYPEKYNHPDWFK